MIVNNQVMMERGLKQTYEAVKEVNRIAAA